MSLIKQLRVVAPRFQQCLYTTGTAGSGPGGSSSSGKTNKTTDKPKEAKTKEKTPPAPQSKPQAKKEPVDNTKYQCNTYYEHKKWTFYDIESQMASRRIGQPSPLKK